MLRRVAVLLALLSTPALAQVTERPIVTADNDDWFRLGQPIQFGGELYYPAGPDVFFDGNIMVRTGHFNGVPLYANATLEPYSVVFVPISRGLMRPYERRVSPIRELRAPSTSPPAVIVETRTPAVPVPVPVGTAGREAAPVPMGTTGRVLTARAPRAVVTVRRPEGNDGLWIVYGGQKWVSAGPAIEIGSVALSNVGDYAGFPVYMRADRQDVIYLPTRPGLMAPYKRK
jgi:hypothetical protein